MQAALATPGSHSPLDGGRPMTRRFSLPRTGALLLAGVLVFLLAGDRGMTAAALGIDPLEVLDLQVKPNVFVVLDTSGSMEDLTNNSRKQLRWRPHPLEDVAGQAGPEGGVPGQPGQGLLHVRCLSLQRRGAGSTGQHGRRQRVRHRDPGPVRLLGTELGSGHLPEPGLHRGPDQLSRAEPRDGDAAGAGTVALDGHDGAHRQLALRLPVDPEFGHDRQQHARLHRGGSRGLHGLSDAGLLH